MRRCRRGLIPALLTLIGFVTTASSQDLREYYVTCDPSQFEYLLSHPDESYSLACSFQYGSQTWENPSLSLREGIYSTFPKKSFKVDFADEDPFEGRDKMNLMAQWNDPSFARQYLALDLFQRAGLPVSQSWFAKLYVNDVYLGLYLDVEEIDSLFLQRAGLAGNASIYKADTVGCLLTPGEATEDLWEKVTNTATGNYDLANLITWIETTPEVLFFGQLSHRFPTTELARAIAANSLLGNQSTYYDNYILIHDINQDGYWRLLPWDADSVLVYWSDYDDPEYYRCGHPLLLQVNALISRCWRNSSMLALIFEQMQGLMDSLFTEEYYQQITDELTLTLFDAVQQDTLKQFSVDDFLTSLVVIPGDVAGRSADFQDQMAHEPLPFDFNPAILTPSGIYFSWERSLIQDSSLVTYSIQIANDPQFTVNVVNLDDSTNTSLLYDQIQPGQYYWRVLAHSPSNEQSRSITFFSPFEIPENAFSGTVVTGTISSDTTWDISGSPYSLPEGLTIAAGAVLTIEPGVLIGIGANRSITIQGGLTAIGTAEDTIHFVPINPDSNWGALNIDHPSDSVDLCFTSTTKGSFDPEGPIYEPGAMIQVVGGQLSVFDSHLNWGSHGAILSDSSSIHLERNLIEHFSFDVIYAHHGSMTIRSCRLAYGAQEGTLWDLVDLENALNSTEINRCEFFNSVDDLLDMDYVANAEITGNYFTGATDKGVSVGAGSNNVTLSNNKLVNSSTAMGIKNTCFATLYNNVIFANGTGLEIIPEEPGAGGITILYNNVLWDNNREIHYEIGETIEVQYCLIEGEDPYPGQGNINTDPLFTDGWNQNFYPLPNSPLIDAGYGTGAPEFDFLDSARYDDPNTPNTGAGDIDYVDIGIYEYYPALVPVVNPPALTPETHKLLENFPNPFNGVTKINFTLRQTGWAEISIYDILGREVFHRRFDRLLPGQHSLLWNGRSSSGIYVASGMYFCRLQTPLNWETQKMILIK